jgi:hypothetical protein
VQRRVPGDADGSEQHPLGVADEDPAGPERMRPPASAATDVKNSGESAARAAMARFVMPSASTP